MRMDFHFVFPLPSPTAVSQDSGSEGLPTSAYFSDIIHADYTYAMAVLNHVYLWKVHRVQAPLSVFLFIRKLQSKPKNCSASVDFVRRLMGGGSEDEDEKKEVAAEAEAEAAESTLPPYFLAFGFTGSIPHNSESHYCVRINLFPRRDLQNCKPLWRRYVSNIQNWIPETQFYYYLMGESELMQEDVLLHLSELGKVCRVEGCQAYAELGSCCTSSSTYLTHCLFTASNYVRPTLHILHNSEPLTTPDMQYMA